MSKSVCFAENSFVFAVGCWSRFRKGIEKEGGESHGDTYKYMLYQVLGLPRGCGG